MVGWTPAQLPPVPPSPLLASILATVQHLRTGQEVADDNLRDRLRPLRAELEAIRQAAAEEAGAGVALLLDAADKLEKALDLLGRPADGGTLRRVEALAWAAESTLNQFDSHVNG